MHLSKIGEFGLIKSLQKKCVVHRPEILTGIGDDTAVIRVADRKLLVTSDMMLEGVHFDLSFSTFSQLGHKLLAINISDIFAMGGKPQYFLVSIGIPTRHMASDIHELYKGITKLAKKFKVAVIGGDTCSSKNGLVLNGTLIGYAKQPIKRSGAKIGDSIFINNTLGDSAMGLRILKNRKKKIHSFVPATSNIKLMQKHLLPKPKPLNTLSKVTSMIDISDGLLIDLSHICDESRVGAVIHKDKVPVSRELTLIAKKFGVDPIELALKGGEDYCLLFTAPSGIKTDAFKIGEIVRKDRFIVDEKGRKKTFKPEGYEHFKKRNSNGFI